MKKSAEPMPRDTADLPSVSPTVFEILLSLTGTERHGYSIMKEIEERTDGRMVIRPGSLYRALHRLQEQGLVEELDERAAPDADDERRRYYQITALGTEAAAAEATRMERAVRAARDKRLIRVR